MEHAKKMALVDPRLLDTLHQSQYRNKPGIAEGAMMRLDQQMQDVLSRQDLTEADKVRMYNEALSRYMVYEHKVKPAKVEFMVKKDTAKGQERVLEMDAEDAKPDKPDDIEEEIVDSAPWNAREKPNCFSRG